MAVTAAQPAIGAGFQVDTTGSGNWTQIGEVVSIDGPALDVGVIRATNLLSPNQFHEKIPGVGDGKQVTLDVTFTRGMMTLLTGYIRVVKNWRVNFQDAITIVTFVGFITRYGNSLPLEDRVITPITLEVTAKPVWT